MSTVNLENTCRNLYSSSVTEPNKLTSHGHQVHFQPEKSKVRVTYGYRADASISSLCNVLLRQRALTGGDLVSVACLASPAWLFDTISAAAHSLSEWLLLSQLFTQLTVKYTTFYYAVNSFYCIL